MGTYIDLSGFLSRYGVTSNTFTSGPNKSMGS
jgi:ClpP class serine protease